VTPAGLGIDVYSVAEIARAAGVHPRDVRALAEAGIITPLTPGGYYSATEAVTAVRTLSGVGGTQRSLFRPPNRLRRQPGMPIALSGTLHAAMFGVMTLMTSLAVAKTQARVGDDLKDLHVVFLASPGPGGGGGGGGLKEPAPPPPAERKGVERMRSPVAVHHPPAHVVAARPAPPPRIDPPRVLKPVDPPPVVKADAIQPVFAPVVAAAPDPRDRAGLPWKGPADSADSHGPGSGGGMGTGQGAGLGEGNGSGIGPGSGGGTGGGPYRPGAGITAPSILREIRPDYTEEGRRRAIEGDVVVEIVVRADGSVGSVTLLKGLGAGLDERAIEAVRQWRFNPAKRYGTPVDVIVEVSVEFKLR
jgi:TonB family protein